MTVRGNGRVSVEPNIAKIQLEVVTEAKQVSQAQRENAKIMNQVINALLQLGIPRENVQTTGYTINPMYDFVEGEQVFKGYQVINTITIQIIGIDQTGNVIDVAVQNGVNRVSNIEFTVKNVDVHYRRALSEALKNALHKAHTLAETMKVTYDQIPIKIVELNNHTQTSFKTFSTLETNESTPIEPGQIVINASVEAQFQY